MRPLTAGVLAAVGCAVTTVACSSGGSTGSASTPTATPAPTPSVLARAAFVQQANAACKNATTGQDQLFSGVSDNPSPAQVSSLVHQTVALYTAYRTQLDPLIASQADAADLRAKWIRYDELDIADLRHLLQPLDKALGEHDTTAARRAAGVIENDQTNNGAKAVAFLRAQGLTDCATLEAG